MTEPVYLPQSFPGEVCITSFGYLHSAPPDAAIVVDVIAESVAARLALAGWGARTEHLHINCPVVGHPPTSGGAA